MTHRERAAIALEGGQPDYVPTFELAFQLTEEAFGKKFHQGPEHDALPDEDRKRLCRENAELYLMIAERYEHSIIMLADNPAKLKEKAEHIIYERSGHYLFYALSGFDGFALCDDYAFNDNPFFSPNQFREFVTPYLKRIIATYRGLGKYVIKHSDGNLMPVFDQLIECRPHAIHSLDPQGRMDIAEIKRRYGRQVALCGNVNCGLVQTGSEAEVLGSCEYAMRHGKPGGGYIFCTSNCAFKGMPLERYELVNRYWKEHRSY